MGEQTSQTWFQCILLKHKPPQVTHLLKLHLKIAGLYKKKSRWMVEEGKHNWKPQERKSTRPFDTQHQTGMIWARNIAKILISKWVPLSQSAQLIVVQQRQIHEFALVTQTRALLWQFASAVGLCVFSHFVCYGFKRSQHHSVSQHTFRNAPKSNVGRN